MIHNAQRIRSSLIGMAFAALLVAFFSASDSSVVDADRNQTPTCAWDSGARMSQSLYFMASAYDWDEGVLYAFGGLNKDFNVQNFMQAIDFSGTTDPGDGETSTRRNGTARLFGATAFYRPSPEADTKGTVYVLFGSKDPGTPSGSGTDGGKGENTVYAYDIETNAWRVVSTGGVALGERLFAAAEYDPVNDIAVVAGGVKQCSIAEVLDGSPCDADAFETLILSFDDTGNITAARGPAGGPRTVYGHTMTYDAAGGRMLVNGGTTNGETTVSNTWVLEMGDASALSWDRVGSGGPSVFGHSAAYWPDNDWLVVHSGASNSPFTTSENVSTRTFALMFDPAGGSWQDLSATTSPTERMGASAEFVSTGEWEGVVVVGGRTRFNESGSTVAANYNALICESGTGPVATETPEPGTPDPTEDPTATMEPGTPDPTDDPTATMEPGTPDPTDEPTATTMPGTAVPTETAVPTATTIPTSAPTAGTPTDSAVACPRLDTYVPASVIADGLARAADITGWGELCYPNSPPSPWNTARHYLSIRNIGAPFHPVYNGLVYKCGCP